jgi:hypothetical protein
VLGVFVGTTFVVPTPTPAWVADDWLYARSVRILLEDHQLRLMNLSVATGVFQVVWGGLFAALFGLTPGVLRASTLVLSALGGAATYALCRELEVKRANAALATAVVLFAPLAYVLGFSFMSDAQFTSLLMVSTFLYARGARHDLRGWTVFGSVVAALAFMVRQQGILIPLAVITWLVLRRDLRPTGSGLRVIVRVAGIPALVAAAYLIWITFVHGVPAAQRSLLREIVRAGWGGGADITARMVFTEAMYIGLFVLPISVIVLLGSWRSLLTRSWRAWLMGTLWAAVVLSGLVVFTRKGLYMPYAPSSSLLGAWARAISMVGGRESSERPSSKA